jgi:hypothetical protein
MHLMVLGLQIPFFLWDFVQTGEEPCPIDPWIVVPDKSKYVDQQTLKMQENPEVIILILVNWSGVELNSHF